MLLAELIENEHIPTIDELAARFDRARQTIQEWLRRGCPRSTFRTVAHWKRTHVKHRSGDPEPTADEQLAKFLDDFWEEPCQGEDQLTRALDKLLIDLPGMADRELRRLLRDELVEFCESVSRHLAARAGQFRDLELDEPR